MVFHSWIGILSGRGRRLIPLFEKASLKQS